MAVMAEAQTSPVTPAGHGKVAHAQLRVTNEDREHVVEHVKAAYAEGRFDKYEFDERLERAMTARTHGDLMPIMNEIYGTSHPRWQPVAPQAVRMPRRSGVPTESNERLGAAAAHLLPVAGLFVIGPLILLLTGGKTSPYIRSHAVEALNFHLTLLGASILLPLTIVGVVLVPVIWMAAFVLAVVAGVSALTENDFRYPLTLRLVK
ncbi:DUF1707 and DUF4870 domain-containing protein [Nonomuraea sp. NPDC046570]|uniref:DUF1707 and DUF4870 domain-containing protein n=1 Tax=Nonomuraea sp. NPDC046570 TaxID=3155255 RepID=UPI003405FF9F